MRHLAWVAHALRRHLGRHPGHALGHRREQRPASISRRPAVFRWPYAIEATRFLESWRWVVSFWISSRFGPRRGRFAEPLVKLPERRRRVSSAARNAAVDAHRRPHAVAALRDAWSSRVGLERRGGRGQERSASLRCAARGRRRAAVNGPPSRHLRDACDGAPRLSGWQAAMGASCFASGEALDRGVVGIASWPRRDVPQAPLRFCGDRCGSVYSIALAAAHGSSVVSERQMLRNIFVSLDSG